MATATLGVAGAAIPGIGPFAGIIGAAIGSYIDNHLLIPAIFGEDEKAAQIADLEVTTANIGGPASHCYGRYTRVGGHVIWSSFPYYESTTTGSDKRGNTQVTVTWFIDIAVVVAYNEMANLDQIWVDNDRLFIADPAVNDTVDYATHVTFDFTRTVQMVTAGAGGAPYIFSFWNLIIENVQDGGGNPVAGAPDLSRYEVGLKVELTLFDTVVTPNPQTSWNHITGQFVRVGWTVVKSERVDSKGNTRLELDLRDYDITATGPGQHAFLTPPTSYYPFTWPITSGSVLWIRQNGFNWNSKLVQSQQVVAEWNRGDPNQTVSAIIDEYLGTDTPTYPGIAYWVIKKLALSPFGDRVPTFSFRVAEGLATRVHQMIQTLASGYGDLLLGDVDISGVDVATLDGLCWSGYIKPADLIAKLMIAYDIIVREHHGRLFFFQGKNRDTVTVGVGDLDARMYDDGPQPILGIHDIPEIEMLRRVDVAYKDVDNDLEGGNEHDIRDNLSGSQDRRVSLKDLSMTSNTARAIARRLLLESHERQAELERASLPFGYMNLQEEDILSVTAYGHPQRALLARVEIGANYLVQCEGWMLTDDRNDPPEGITNPATVDKQPTRFGPSPLAMMVVDLGPLTDAEVTTFGYYVAVSPFMPKSGGTGGQIFRNLDGGTDFLPLASVKRLATMGWVRNDFSPSKLADASPAVFDYASEVHVELFNGELESVTEADVMAGRNWCVIGKEIVGVVNMVLIEANTYKLTGFLRGLVASDHESPDHVDNESFVFLDDSIQHVRQDFAEKGIEQNLRCVGPGLTVDDAFDNHILVEGYSARPLGVANLKATVEPSGDVVFTWDRRSRLKSRLFSEDATPLVEGVEEYIAVVPLASPVRTTTITAETWTYDDADQTSDGMDALDDFTVEIYQTSPTTGRGMVRVITIDVDVPGPTES